MDEQENEQPDLVEQGMNFAGDKVKNAAKNAAKKVGKEAFNKAFGKIIAKVTATIVAHLLPIIGAILVVVLLASFVLELIDGITDIFDSNVDKSVTLNANGLYIQTKEELMDQINTILQDSNIDIEELELGNEEQAKEYLYKFMLASISTELPYIEGSDAVDGISGIVKIKRNTGGNVKNLKYVVYDKFYEKIKNNDSSAIECFTIDENWNLYVAKQTVTKTTDTNGKTTTNTTITDEKIPYKSLISKYSVPFNFFIVMQQVSTNAEYVSAIADLILDDGEIELTIFDSTETITTESTYKYDLNKKWMSRKLVKVESDDDKNNGSSPTPKPNPNKPTFQETLQQSRISTPRVAVRSNVRENINNDRALSTSSKTVADPNLKPDLPDIELPDVPDVEMPDLLDGYEWVDDPQTSVEEGKIETVTTVTEITTISTMVTKANVWVIKHESEYNSDTQTEYPYGENGTTATIDNEGEPPEYKRDEVQTWKTNQTQTTKQTIVKNVWQAGNQNTTIEPDTFLGLWKNEFGYYVKGAKYEKEGKIVKYKLPTSSNQQDSPLTNLLGTEQFLYELLEKSEYTQTHAQLMRYLFNLYRTGEGGEIDLSTFDTYEFKETNWSKFGSGYWWPLNDTTQTRITSNFGLRGAVQGTTHTSAHMHSGIDIGVPVGSEVIASADGTVEIAGYSDSAGNWIRIDHGNGVKTVYMHNSVLLVSVGQEVKQGDIISLSGNTGNSNGPHLHFGVQVNGEYTNPLEYVNPDDPRPASNVPDVPANVEAWRPYIMQAFEELGYTCTDEKVEAILRQIKTESGGNQFIIQGIVDTNTGKPITIENSNGLCPWCPAPTNKSCGHTNIGHGLLQFIPTTFYANMIDGHTNIFNGYDQICTCITMLEKRSGSYTDYIGKGTGWG